MTTPKVTGGTPSRIRRLRDALGLTQVEMAERLGVAFTTLNRWERGKREPLPAHRRQIEALEHEFAESQKQHA